MAAAAAAARARIAARIPKGTWDTHMHVLDPHRFPLPGKAAYDVHAHSLADAQAFLGSLGIERMNIVQPSVYGNDNGCTLDGLRGLGTGKGRAFVQFEPAATSAQQLREWHALGVRGVRLNYKSAGAAVEGGALAATLARYADAVRELGWALELYISLEDVPVLEPVVARLGPVKLCIDHFGHPSEKSVREASSARDLPGFDALLRLLQQGRTWVKVSASYRITSDARSAIVESACRELVRARPDRCLFATDWPHTRYDGLEVSEYLGPILDWIEDEGVSLKTVLVDNAEAFFDGGLEKS